MLFFKKLVSLLERYTSKILIYFNNITSTYLNSKNPQLSTGCNIDKSGMKTTSIFFNGTAIPKYSSIVLYVLKTFSYAA